MSSTRFSNVFTKPISIALLSYLQRKWSDVKFLDMEVEGVARFEGDVEQRSFVEFERTLKVLLYDVRIAGVKWYQWENPYLAGFATEAQIILDNVHLATHKDLYLSPRWIPYHSTKHDSLALDLREKMDAVVKLLKEGCHAQGLFFQFGQFVEVVILPRAGIVQLHLE